MKVLSLAWKYHPFVTSGVGVACEGLNNALSKLVDLTVIYPKVANINVQNEEVLSGDDLNEEQTIRLANEYTALVEEQKIELALRLDPYFTSNQSSETKFIHLEKEVEAKRPLTKKIESKGDNGAKLLPFEEVDVFGENVQDKIFLYNRLVEELAQDIEFDLIHAHDWMTFLAGISLKNKFNKPLVIHVHSLEFDRVGHKNASWVYSIERFTMSKADMVITTSAYTKGIIESNYGLSGEKIQPIPNAITVPEYSLENKEPKGPDYKVLFVGRIDGNKGIEYFIDIAKQLLKKVTNVQFIVVGRGRGEVDFEAIDGFSEIKDNFHYAGFVEREKLFSLYKECDVLCMPSISEPFGLTAIEAAYMSLPVVLSTKTGASEILHRTAKANFWDTAKFASHMHTILKNPKFRKKVISNNLKDISNLSWEGSATKVLSVYKNVLSEF